MRSEYPKLWKPTRRLFLAGGALIAAPAIVRAGTLPLLGVGKPAGGAAVYAGPGDIAAYYAWAGLRAYTLASIGSTAIRLVRASDSAQQDFVTVAGGGLDMTSINTFLTATTGKVVTLYDQTGGTYHFTQGTDANRPAFTLSAFGSLPGITFAAGSQSLDGPASVNGGTGFTQPFTITGVAQRTGTFTSFNTIIGASAAAVQLLFSNAANLAGLFAGSVVTASATDSVSHSLIGVFNGASSVISVDNTETTVSAGTNSITGADTISIGKDNNAFTGLFGEGGVVSSTMSAGNRTSTIAQARAWYGF